MPDPRSHRRVPYVWILPALVVLAGAFVAIQQKIAQGTSIEISFRTADDLEPNKTKIRYKAVEIGEVTAIHVAKDRKQVDRRRRRFIGTRAIISSPTPASGSCGRA